MDQLSALLSDPSWFPAAIDTTANTIDFAKINRESLSSEAFLDQRMEGSVRAQQTAPLSDVIAALSGQQSKYCANELVSATA